MLIGFRIVRSKVSHCFLPRQWHSYQDNCSRMIDSLKKDFDISRIKIEENPRYRVLVSDPIFHDMSLDLQHKLVKDILPEDIREKVVIETSDVPQINVDREVKKVYLNKNLTLPPENNIPATPQSLLDSSVYHLSKNSGLLASEALWLSGSLALKNFCLNNGFDTLKHVSKNHVVTYLTTSYGLFPLRSSWSKLQDCHQNAYEDYLSLKVIFKRLDSAEMFCNLLYEVHYSKKFNIDDFKKKQPKYLTKEGNMYFDFKQF